MSYTALEEMRKQNEARFGKDVGPKQPDLLAGALDRNDLKSAVLRFLHNRCEGLRFSKEKTDEEKACGHFLGTSISAHQIPYNMQKDIDRLCLEREIEKFIDSGVAAIERQIRRNKTRLEKRLRDGVLERDAVPAYVPAEEEDKEEEFKVVRSKRFSIKPMSVQEAILQMNLLGHEFFVFRNMDAEDAISVVYERKNGGYGLICDDGLND